MTTVEIIYKDKRFLNECRRITKGDELFQDLFQHCVVRIHNRNKVIEPKGLFRYFSRVAKNEWIDKTSEFNRTYKRLTEINKETVEVEEDEKTEFQKFIDNWIEKPTSQDDPEAFMKKNLFIAYLDFGSTRKVSAQTGIKLHLVKTIIKTTIKEIENEYLETCNN